MTMKLKSRVSAEYADKKITLYRTQAVEYEGELALALLERWGMVAATDDGEDSTGRSKLALLRPEQVVERAFTVAHLAIKELDARGLFATLPDLNEVNAERDRKSAAREAKEPA